MNTFRVALLTALGLVLPVLAAAQPVADDPFSFGMQTGMDVVFEDPVFMAQTGPVAHVRFDAQHSMRAFAGYAFATNLEPTYVATDDPQPEILDPIDGTPLPRPSTGPRWRDRHMFSLRLSEGFTFDPVIEGRLFGEVRFVAIRTDAQPAEIVASSEEPIAVPDGADERWFTDWSVGGGTEWIVRPESSRRLELGISLGVAAVSYDTYDPSGGLHTWWSPQVYGGLSVGWLFF